MPKKRQQSDEELHAEFESLRDQSTRMQITPINGSAGYRSLAAPEVDPPVRTPAEIIAESSMLLAESRAKTIALIRTLDPEARAILRGQFLHDKDTLADIDAADTVDEQLD